MIGINLLPYHLRPIKRTPLPYMVTAAILVLAILGMASLWLVMQGSIISKNIEYKNKQNKMKELKQIVDENNELVKKTEDLADKMATIQQIAEDRIIWSRQLFNLSRLTPDNFWYKSITEKLRKVTELKKVLNPKTQKEETKTVTEDRRILEIQGYVIKGQDGNQDIYPLTFNLEKDPEFAAMFMLNLTNLQDTEFDGYQVRSFTLEYGITPKAKTNDSGSEKADGSGKPEQAAKKSPAPAGEKK